MLAGTVEKGPFITGSEVEAALLDESGVPTGVVYITSTDALGEFELPIGGELARLWCSGFFHDELGGGISGAPLTLNAIATPSAKELRVNVLTHLITPRVLALAQKGSPIDEAIATAEREIVAAIDIGPHVPGRPFSELAVIGAVDLDDTYLVVVGVVLLGASAQTRAGAAGLQLLLNDVAADLAEDGMIAPELVTMLDDVERWIDGDAVEANLAALSAELGVPWSSIDLDAIIDTDGDGVVNAEDNCDHHPNPGQADEDGDEIGDACDAGDDEIPAWCPYEGDTDLDDDGFGDIFECDTCPIVPGLVGEHCCDPRSSWSTCKKPYKTLYGTKCGIYETGGFSCGGWFSPTSSYGGTCTGCSGPCISASAFPPDPNADPLDDCAGDRPCCSKACTVTLDDCPGAAHCLPWFAPGTEPPQLIELGICVDTSSGPCAVAGAIASTCAGATW